MARRSKRIRRTNVLGTCYLIHFDKPLSHANHYLGWTEGDDIEKRIATHEAGHKGHAACILRACKEQGIGWKVVRTWKNVDRNFERWLKKQSNSPKFCPKCDPWAENKGLHESYLNRLATAD